jgi:hypothetical protein
MEPLWPNPRSGLVQTGFSPAFTSTVENLEFLEWTDSNHVGNIKFVALRDDKNPRKITRK